uniref:Uncharacterized protein n=1 Tax=Trichobilharzia regenti TaxID=157069 RepID=A0AA85KKQ7_TRIRE|nr:unnamed protein product [Trichobilharzia regenti]
MRNLFLNNLDKYLQLCQDIKYTYGTTASSHSLLLDNPMLTVIAKHELLTGDNATSYPNQSISNQTSVNNTSERSSLPYIIGVIIAFLVILIGIILIVNREVCNQHRGYHQHRSPLASMISVGGVGGAAAATKIERLYNIRYFIGEVVLKGKRWLYLNFNDFEYISNDKYLYNSSRFPITLTSFTELTTDNTTTC